LTEVIDSDRDLIAVALDAGFASHSHFTARFGAFFGLTPVEARRKANSIRIDELRKIVTARAYATI
jgi:transcriptional regulator GlxA family with amidase domain